VRGPGGLHDSGNGGSFDAICEGSFCITRIHHNLDLKNRQSHRQNKETRGLKCRRGGGVRGREYLETFGIINQFPVVGIVCLLCVPFALKLHGSNTFTLPLWSVRQTNTDNTTDLNIKQVLYAKEESWLVDVL